MSDKRCNQKRKSVRRFFLIVGVMGACVASVGLIQTVHSHWEAVRNSPNKGALGLSEPAGEFWADYFNRFPVEQPERVGHEIFVSDVHSEHSSIVATFRVRENDRQRLKKAARTVFEEGADDRKCEEAVAAFRRLIAAGEKSVPYVVPYLASVKAIPHKCSEITPESTGFSRCHQDIRTQGQLAAIVMSRLTGDETIVERQSSPPAYCPVWLWTAVDSDPLCQSLPRMRVGRQLPPGLPGARILFEILLEDWKSKSSSNIPKVDEEWSTVVVRL